MTAMRGTTTATGDRTTGGMTTATRGPTTGDTMTATGDTAMRHDDGDGRHNNCKTYCSCTLGKWICRYFILTYLKFLWKYQFWRSILNLVKMAATVTNIFF
jgi:hypothetical protein